MENQVQLNHERKALLGKFAESIPEFMQAEAKLLEVAYREGALSSKFKRLMALAVALKDGCTNCIISQTENAVKEGATKAEILETLQVVIAMGGTTGVAESLRVIQFLDELGHL